MLSLPLQLILSLLGGAFIHNIDLASLMRTMTKKLDYFVKIERAGKMVFEKEYHDISTDPDGRKRDLLNEREHNLLGMHEVTTFLDKQPAGRILDIGCGPGWLLSHLSADWIKYGIEISTFASSVASKYGEIYNGNFEEYHHTGEKFDIIVIYHVIEHLHDPLAALIKIHDLLADGGTLILGTPDFDSAAARRYGKNFRMLDDPTHISLFSNDSMHRCLRDHNFEIQKVEYPYFDTIWFNKESIMKIFDVDTVSPPFYGSIMTFFCSTK
jgi:SAM-dependent methyltransferase